MRLLSLLWRWASHFVGFVRKSLHLILLLLIFSFIVSAIKARIPVPLESRLALVIPFEGVLEEEVIEDPFAEARALLSGHEEQYATSLATVRKALQKAKDDERIDVVVLDMKYHDYANITKSNLLQKDIQALSKSGKPVWAYADSYDQSSYALVASADKIAMHPSGGVMIQGYGRYRQYFKEAIDKLKIDWNVFKVGEYKSFVEPFTRSNMSEADKTSSKRWMDQLWDLYLDDVSASRGMKKAELKSYVSRFYTNVDSVDGDLAALALEKNMVDMLISREAFEQDVVDIVGRNQADNSYRQIDYRDYVKRINHPMRAHAVSKVGVVVAAGDIVDGYNVHQGAIGDEDFIEKLRLARFDDSVKAIVLRIDSGGGSKLASEHIATEIRTILAEGKPVVASMGGVAASGGYWIAMYADAIYATQNTITGSIGIGGFFPTFNRSLEHMGVYTDGFGTTDLAGSIRLDRPLNVATRNLIQSSVEHGYVQFIEGVSEARDMPLTKVKRLAEGRVWSGIDAKKLGLIDELGDLDAAVIAAAKLADLRDYNIEYIKDNRDWQTMLAEELMVKAVSTVKLVMPEASWTRRAYTLISRVDPVKVTLDRLMAMRDPMYTYAWCWCEVR